MPDKDVMLQIKQLDEQLGWRALDAEAKAAAEGSSDASWPLREALAELSGGWRMLADLYERAKLKGAKTTYIEPLRHAAVQLDKVIKQLEQPRRAPLGRLQANDAAPAHESAGLDEPRHRFIPGTHTNGTCMALVQRDGEEAWCGRYASHPAHRLDGPTERPGLDALIAEASSEGAALGVTGAHVDAVIIGDVTLPAVDDGPITVSWDSRGNAAVDFPGQASGDEVAAYLRGDADDIPGAPPLAPSTVRDATEPADDLGVFGIDERDFVAPAPNEDSQAAIDLPHDGDDELSMPVKADTTYRFVGEHSLELTDIPAGREIKSRDEWAMTSAKETLATVTTDPAIPPVPLLGQPGDAGAGYSPAYAPPGGVPLTYAELLTPVPYASLPAHLSHSQIETIADCPTKYRAQRLDSVPRGGDPIVEIPQWALIGGKAFHAAVEDMERWFIIPGNESGKSKSEIVPEPGAMWRKHFDTEVQKVEASQPVPRSRWRASKQGAEGETWWNANGPEMLRRYLAARPDQPTLKLSAGRMDGSALPIVAIEWEIIASVPTAYGPIEYKATLDRVTWDERRGAYVIRDYKTGASMPSDTSQLGEYANALRLAGLIFPDAKVYGTFFNARKGTWTPEVDLDAAWPAEWFVYHVTAGHAQRLALTQGPTPARPSSFCGGCSVRWACPIKNGASR